MRPIFVATIIITALLAVNTYSLSAQTPEQLFQKGLTKEEGEGALKDAINLYNQVAENSNATASLRAKALMHVGMCYEKLGTKEAVKAYQRLVANFPSQKNEVAYARERLTKLTPISESFAETNLNPKFTKINIPSKLSWNVALSPDGKNLALVSEQKLWLMPLSGNISPGIAGKPVQVNTEGVKVEWTGLAWSGNGNWIAFNEDVSDSGKMSKRPEKEQYYQKIFIVPGNGGKPRQIVDNYRSARVVNYRISLSPDGGYLAYSSIEDNKQHIYTTKVTGGTPKRLADLPSREPVFSPDGKMIAFVEDKDLGSQQGGLGLWAIPSQGGTPQLVAKAEAASSPVWSPDGKTIAFLDYSKNKQIFFVQLPKEKETYGKVTSIDIPEGAQEIRLLAGWTRENKLGALMTSKSEFAIYTLPATGGQAAIISNDCYASQPRWSPDGKHIYYSSIPKEGVNRANHWFLSAVPSVGGIGNPILGDEKGEGKEFSFLPYQGGNRVSPDGKWIVSAAVNPEDTSSAGNFFRTKIWKIAIDGSKSLKITNSPRDYADLCPSWSPDGTKIAYLRTRLTGNEQTFGSSSIFIVNSSGGESRMLIPESDKYVFSPVWSPDGKMIAYLTANLPTTERPNLSDPAVNTVSISTCEARVIGKAPIANVNIELAWSPDSKRISFNGDNLIKVINVDDGKIEDIKTNLVDAAIWHLDWSRDGEQFVFGGMKGGNPEFWFVDNFLPLEKLAGKKEKEDMLIRKALPDTDIEPLGTPSPDGRYITFIDWNSGGNVGILNLVSKERRLLTDFKDPNEQAYYSSWSPDGKQIAYFWWKYDKDQYNLSIVDVNKAESRNLFISDKYDWIELGNWSSDGKYIVATLSLKGKPESQLVRIPSTDGSLQILKTFDKAYPGGKPCFSPDNSYVAYNFPDDKAPGNNDIYIYSIKDEKENALFIHPANDYVLGWTPDGKNILFATDRRGTVDAMIIGVEAGKSIGQPKSIKQDIGPITPMGFTRNGTLFYGQWPNRHNIYTAKFDFDNGKILTQPTLSIRQFEGKNRAPIYSNNGRYLAYISDRGSGRLLKPTVLCIHDMETGKESDIIPDPEINWIRSLLWSPDDQSITMQCYNKEKYARIYNYDIKTNKFSPVVPAFNDDSTKMNYFFPQWSWDGKSLYYLQSSGNSPATRIMIRNIATGNENELCRFSSDNYYDRIFTLSLSPDGQWLSAISMGVNKVVRLISTKDGNSRDLYSFKSIAEGPYAQIWSKDGKYIIFTYPKRLDNGEMEWNLMRIPFEGGETVSIKTDIIGMLDPSLHPDGRTLSFESTGDLKFENNIWAMENFLPEQ